MGGVGEWLFGKKAKVNPYGALNPEQVNVNKQIGPYLQSRISQGPTAYGKTMTAEFGDDEQGVLNKYNTLSDSRNAALQRILGTSDTSFDDEFTSEVADPTVDYFKREIQPLIEESLPTFSTARANVVGRNLTNLTGDLAQKRFDARQLRRDQALQASNALDNAWSTAAERNAVPREIKQAGFDREYIEFTRQEGEKTKYVNDMLNFLGISTGTVDSATAGNFIPLINSIANVVSAVNPAGGSTSSVTQDPGTTAKLGDMNSFKRPPYA